MICSVLFRCGGTVGAIVTCPLEVLKTRLQSSSLDLRPVFQVQMGSLSGTGVIRPGTVTPGLLQVLRYVPTAAKSSIVVVVVVVLKGPHRYHTVCTPIFKVMLCFFSLGDMHFPLLPPAAAPSCYVRAVVLGTV